MKILLLDDHSLFINGMKFLLNKAFEDIEIRSFNSIEKLLNAGIDFNSFHLLISDLELPNEDVFPMFKNLKKKTNIPILVISMHQKISLINKCIKNGVDGYILKNDDEYLIQAVTETINGNKYFSPKIRRMFSDFSLQNKLLSEREEQVIKYICGGFTNQKIADFLSISIETVKTHKKNIKIKLGVSETSELIKYANENILF